MCVELVPELIDWSAIFIAFYEDIGRGERIRTSGPCLPKAVSYQPTVQKPFNNQASTPQLHAKFPDRS